MNSQLFKQRTRQYALRVIKLVDALPRDNVSRRLGDQLLRSACSVAANYRASTRAKSMAEFISKMGIVEEECDESLLWMELLIESGRVAARLLNELQEEGNEILAMTVASIKTSKRRRNEAQLSR